MIKKLRYLSNYKICLDQFRISMLTPVLLLMGPASTMLVV